jgi:hypothetical protein
MKGSPVIPLKEPDELSLENAYRSLPKTGEITVDTSLSTLTLHLEQLEQVGFAGMKIASFKSPDERILIRAFKGKQGTCYNTGRKAGYTGGALAALDDDHHLLLKDVEVPVCEKTANLYSVSTYRDLIHCTEADKELLNKLHKEPDRFESGPLEDSLEKLYAMTRDKKLPVDWTDLFYPGPFRILVLDDGTMIRRGKVNKVPAQIARRRMKSDGLTKVGGIVSSPYESFPELYRIEGPRCLLKKSGENSILSTEGEPNFSSLKNIPGELRTRIINTLKNRKDYFMLTGSNRADQFGCCPSDEVTGADRLVRAGILSASREPDAPDACPLTLYAFRNEISSGDGNLYFNQDQPFRQELLSRIKNNPTRVLKVLARWALLIFVAFSVILSMYRFTGPSAPSQGIILHDRLHVTGSEGTVLVLFHYIKRCDQCRTMEKFAKEVLEDEFQGQVENKTLYFREMEIDQPENRGLVEELGIFTSTLVIVNYGKLEKDSIRVLDRSWALYDNETEFKQMLTHELNQMIDLKDE